MIMPRSKSTVHIPIKHTHSLSKHGYSTKLAASERRAALVEAVSEQKALKGTLRRAYAYVIHKLSALSTLSKRTNPRASAKFKQNMRWVQKKRNRTVFSSFSSPSSTRSPTRTN